MISTRLIEAVRQEFALDWNGLHGAPHWARVRENGLRLAEITGARAPVVELFAFLHDARRRNDGHDPGHGRRAAELAKQLQGDLFELEPEDLNRLYLACRGHSNGGTEGDVTVVTCWDADRLDLGRVGIRPQPDRLCTDAARDPAVLGWAYERSLRWTEG